MRKPNYDRFPTVAVPNGENACVSGWSSIAQCLQEALRTEGRKVLTVECYTGIYEEELLASLIHELKPAKVITTGEAFLPDNEIDALVAPFNGGDDPIFGWICNLRLPQFFDMRKIEVLRAQVKASTEGTVLIFGVGASMVHAGDVLVYADLARWESQLRQRTGRVNNLGVENKGLKASLQYKRAYFTDWRVMDRWKKPLIETADFWLDTHGEDEPRLAEGAAVRRGLLHAATRPFRVVPFFDPGPWGGQWMKEVCDLDRSAANYAWCFDCVPEENSLLLGFGEHRVEMPSTNLVFDQPQALLGEQVHARFGTEFPIRFDFLDTIKGGHLSLQVHPLTEYIQDNFGMNYTQDESYYMLDATDDACVYLGTKTGVNSDEMISGLRKAQEEKIPFNDEAYINKWPAKKHDHFLIPAGTIHCSGAGAMVLEISATPYIFTFKLWDWGRLGLDGHPRPINIEHGKNVIQWNRETEWVKENLINQVVPLAEGEGWREERTGLHECEFIETRRHWFTGRVAHDTRGGVNVLNLIKGEEVTVESPTGAFDPYVVHYAETFIVPAAVGAYSIRPSGPSIGRECGTIKAFVRSEVNDV